ncbi:transcription initiation factor TFIID subunit 12 [Diutina catenulata]
MNNQGNMNMNGGGQFGAGGAGQASEGQAPRRVINIQAQHIPKLIQSMRVEEQRAQQATDEAARQKHRQQAAKIRQILMQYQQQQRAQAQQGGQTGQNQGQSQQQYAQPQSQQQPQQQQQQQQRQAVGQSPSMQMRQQPSGGMQSGQGMQMTPQQMQQLRMRQQQNQQNQQNQQTQQSPDASVMTPSQPGQAQAVRGQTQAAQGGQGQTRLPVSMESFNMIRRNIQDVQQRILILEQRKSANPTPEQLQQIERELVEYKVRQHKYQRLGLDMKNQIMAMRAQQQQQNQAGGAQAGNPSAQGGNVAQKHSSPMVQPSPMPQGSPMTQSPAITSASPSFGDPNQQFTPQMQQMRQPPQQANQVRSSPHMGQAGQPNHIPQQQSQQMMMQKSRPGSVAPPSAKMTPQMKQQQPPTMVQQGRVPMPAPGSASTSQPQTAHQSPAMGRMQLPGEPQGTPGASGAAGGMVAGGLSGTPTASAGASGTPAAAGVPGPTAATAGSGAAAGTPKGTSSAASPPPRRDSASLGSQSVSVPSIPISATINVKPPVAVTFNAFSDARPTLSGGAASSAGSYLSTPAITKLPTFELATAGPGTAAAPDNKRKLIELVNTMGVDDGDGKTQIDGNVEELLLDLADEFVNSVTGFACRLAKHRKANSIDAKDVQLHLERNWNIRVPGFAMDTIRSSRRLQPAPSYNQKVQGVEIAKSVNGNIN